MRKVVYVAGKMTDSTEERVERNVLEAKAVSCGGSDSR